MATVGKVVKRVVVRATEEGRRERVKLETNEAYCITQNDLAYLYYAVIH